MLLPSRPVPPAPAPANAAPKRTIFRKLTTRFNRNRSRSASPPPGHRLAAKEARQAALRERGLLPPLPLSVQERQQDLRIAIVASPQSSSLERRPTAANRIKEEWEAKNRERLTEFRFGGNSPRQETFHWKLSPRLTARCPPRPRKTRRLRLHVRHRLHSI
ncbi:hypothetical protein B0H10DRAFT_404351 [Mycena sp. CBHHK59/15]|nr:hypothetical protein B0H10DRAFT_404351 [Mycena sp. CBHHK59/15]